MPDETDRQRKDALRQKVGLKTLLYSHFHYFLFSISAFFFYTPVAFTWNELSSMNTIWCGWRTYGMVDMIKLSQCKRTSRRSASMCPEPRSWKPWCPQTTDWALRRPGPRGMSSEVVNTAQCRGKATVCQEQYDKQCKVCFRTNQIKKEYVIKAHYFPLYD